MSRARDNADLGDSYGVLGAGVTGGSGLDAVSAGGFVHILTASLPAATNTGTTFDDFYSSSYKSYYVVFRDVEMVADSESFFMQFTLDSDQSVEAGASYRSALSGYGSGGGYGDTTVFISEVGQTKMKICPVLGNAAGEVFNGTYVISGLQNTTVHPTFTGVVGFDHGNAYTVSGSWTSQHIADPTTLYSGFYIYTATGNFAGGSISVFGIKES